MAKQQKKANIILTQITLILSVSLLLSVIFQWLTGSQYFWWGFLAAFTLIFTSGVILYCVWRIAGKGKSLAWMMVVAFLIRLALAVFLDWGLPRFGYPESTQEEGFVFRDAFNRETSAWELAKSEDPVWVAFSDVYGADQYGGMLAMSASVYRYLSPDLFRPALVSILAAAAMTLSLPFLTATLKHWFDKDVILWAGWIFALYPEGVLLGGSQMREPFLILLITVNLWATALFFKRKIKAVPLVVFFLSIIGLFVFSYRVAIPVLGVIALWIWVMELSRIEKIWKKILGWLIIGAVGAGIIFYFRGWIVEVFRWDALLTFAQSGMIQFQLEELPKALHFPFITLYGLFQPVLPAVIVAPAKAVWTILGVFRAVGWYALFPVLFHAAFRVRKDKQALTRNWLTVFVFVVWLWIFIASARAGGDQWDNPRYRTLFLPWMVVVAGWTINYAFKTKDRWLKRIFLVESVFIGLFTFWYVDRYHMPNFSFGFSWIVLLILIISMIIIIGGALRDSKEKRHSLTELNEKL